MAPLTDEGFVVDFARKALDYDESAQQADIGEAGGVTLRAKRINVNDVPGVCAIERARVASNEKIWLGLCQMNARTADHVPAWAASAKIAAQIVIEHKQMRLVKNGRFDLIPRGANIYFGMGEFGHVMPASRHNAFSNDYYERGAIDIVPRDIPRWNGRRHIIGWSLWTPYGMITGK